MQILNPFYLILLVIIPLFLIFSLKSYSQMKKWLAAFGGIRIKKLKNIGRVLVLALVLLLAIFSLAGLNVKYEALESQREGMDIVIGLDTSRSMLAEDTIIPDQNVFLEKEQPSRLNRGRFEAIKIVDQLNGERVGLYYFAFRGTKVVDLTRDYALCNYILQNTESMDVAFTGSNLDYALKTGEGMFRADSKHKVLVFISDGELENQSQMELVLSEAKKLQEEGVVVYTIGLGGREEALIPKRWASIHEVDWFRDSKGNLLKTKMNEEILMKVASVTGGRHFYAQDASVAESVVQEILKGAKHVKALKKPVKQEVCLAPLLLFALLLVWLVWEILTLTKLVNHKRTKS